jgi:ribosome-associated translation inhibitor RaiA
MKLPVDIRFAGIEASAALDTAIRERVRRLEHKFPQAIAWRVVVEQPHRAHRQGREVSVRIDVTMPGCEIAVGNFSDEDPFRAVRDAFDAAARRMRRAFDGVEQVEEHPGNGWADPKDEEGPSRI